MNKKYWLLGAGALALGACGDGADQTEVETPTEEIDEARDADETVVAETMDETDADRASEGETEIDRETMSDEERLDAALATQSDEAKARYEYRNPAETIAFFEIEPGMTVVEALPGGGWYTKILLPYLGPEGRLIGLDYAIDMWPKFGGFATPEFVEGKKSWPSEWTAQAEGWAGEDGAAVRAATFGTMPENLEGEADRVLFIRALHNLRRFEDDGGFMTQALGDAFAALKPGGMVGVVQHRAPEDASADWADGEAGYLKQQDVVDAFEAAGFEFVEASEINANPADNPTEDDIVWRLPPTYGTAGDDDAVRAEMNEIGESDRMTLKFRKPA